VVALAGAGVLSIRLGAEPPLGPMLVIDGIAKIGALVAAILMYRMVAKPQEPARSAPAAPSIRVGALAGIAFLPVMLAISLAQQWTYDAAGWELKGQEIVRQATGGDDATLLALAFFAVVTAPVYEEWVFRLWVHGGLRRFMDPWPATLVSAAAFSLYHLEPDAFPVTFALGLAAGFLRERTGGLHAPIALHACYNAVQVVGIVSARGG
jgi:membrane protease YdiL (CAAX protease family)